MDRSKGPTTTTAISLGVVGLSGGSASLGLVGDSRGSLSSSTSVGLSSVGLTSGGSVGSVEHLSATPPSGCFKMPSAIELLDKAKKRKMETKKEVKKDKKVKKPKKSARRELKAPATESLTLAHEIKSALRGRVITGMCGPFKLKLLKIKDPKSQSLYVQHVLSHLTRSSLITPKPFV